MLETRGITPGMAALILALVMTLILDFSLCFWAGPGSQVRAEELLQVKRPPALGSAGQEPSQDGRSYDIVADILSRGVDGEGRKYMIAGDVSFYLAGNVKFYSQAGKEIDQSLFTSRRMVGLMLNKQERVTAVYLMDEE